MPLLQWERRFYVNDARLDSDHRQMFNALNDLWQIVDQDSEPSTIESALANVSALMKAHFENEEALLDEWNYPRLQDHRQEHRQFIDRLDLLTKRQTHGGRGIDTAETLDLIGDWLCNHILKRDRGYALFRAGQSGRAGAGDEAAAYRMTRRLGLRRLNKAGASRVLVVTAANLFVAGLLGYGLHLVATDESLAPWRAEVFKAITLLVPFLLFSSAVGWSFWRFFGVSRKVDHSAQLLRETARVRQRLSEAQRIARFGFIEVAADRDLWFLDEEMQEMLGLAPTQISGSPEEVLAKAVPEDRARLLERLRSSDAPAFEQELRVENRTLHVLAGTAREDRDTPLIIMTFKDITQLRTAEEERARMLERVSEASRLESLGTLAGGIAHEINTPAQFIGDNLSFIRDWLPRLLAVVEEARRSVEKGSLTDLAERLQSFKYDFAARELPAAAEQGLLGIRRISGIVQAIKEFSYPSGKTPELFDLNYAIERTATITHNEWKYVAELNLDLTPGLPLLNAIEGEIAQVLVNLIVNAAQAIEEKGAHEKGRIDIHSRQIDGAIEFSVSDSGVGIPKENFERLYELFFTTKPPGKGTGQGLALSKTIISHHGGTIAVSSELGVGTSFHVRLPISGRPLL